MNNEDMSNIFNQLTSMLNNNSNSNPNSENSDVSSHSSNINLDNLKDMLNNMTSNTNSDNSSNNSDNQTTPNIDIDTILKIQSIMSKLNSTQNDPRSNLLLSLKPYLNDKRKNKLDQYMQFLKISKVLESLDFNGGVSKK